MAQSTTLTGELGRSVSTVSREVRQGHRLVVRNGYHAEREVATAAGAVPVRQPRVNDRRILVEVFFGIITRQAIRRGTFPSVTDLVAAIRAFDGWNERCEPFLWTKTAEEILTHATPKQRKGTSFTRH